MFRRFLGSAQPVTPPTTRAEAGGAAGETATVRRIVARLEAMPPERARLIASAAYTLARAANADLDISDEETGGDRAGTPGHEGARRGDRGAGDPDGQAAGQDGRRRPRTTSSPASSRPWPTTAQRLDVLRACFAISAANGTISAEETAVLNQIAARARHRRRIAQRDPRRLPRAAVVGPADPPGHRAADALHGDGRPATGRSAEWSSTRPSPEPAADLGQQLGVVGDAAAQLHRQRRAAARPRARG